MLAPSCILVLEGLPCSGKTSLGRRLSARHSARVTPEVTPHLSDGEPLGLDAAIRNDHAKRRFALERGGLIVFDRYIYSTLAYEVAKSDEKVNLTYLEALARRINVSRLSIPHTVLIWKIKIETSIERSKKDHDQVRGPEWQSPRFLERFASAYEVMLAHKVPEQLGLINVTIRWIDPDKVDLVADGLCHSSSCSSVSHE